MMTETLIQFNGELVWFAPMIVSDLVQQARLKREDFEIKGVFNFNYRNSTVIVSHSKDTVMFVSTDFELEDLIDGFSEVVSYKPFAAYVLKTNEGDWVTYEWNKINPLMRYFDLIIDPDVKELTQL